MARANYTKNYGETKGKVRNVDALRPVATVGRVKSKSREDLGCGLSSVRDREKVTPHLERAGVLLPPSHEAADTKADHSPHHELQN